MGEVPVNLKFEDIVKLQVLVLMYNANNQELPCNIQQLFSKDKNAQCKTRQMDNFNHKYARTELKTRCFNFWGQTLE